MLKKIQTDFINIIVFVLIIISTIYGAGAQRPSIFDRMFFGGLNTSVNFRQGKLEFTDQYSQIVTSPDLFTLGLNAGKRFSLFAKLRLSVPLDLDFGSQSLDSLYGVILVDGQSVNVIKKARYYHAGISPVLQMPFNVNYRSNLYLCAGGGIHLMKYLEIMHQIGNPLARVNSDFLENGLKFSFSADAGIGYELIVSKRYGIAFQYNFRYWNPVKYLTRRGGIFLYRPVTYREKFMTHSFEILILGI